MRHTPRPGGKVVRETIGSGSTAKVLDFIYDNQGKPFALNYSTDGGKNFSTYYYILNLQGDVVKLINASGTTVATYTYNAWGEILSSSGSMASVNPLRYRGYYYDSETGFYYLQSRYYDPVTHRFINADGYTSTGQGLLGYNMFAYCLNNSVSLDDQSGMRGMVSLVADAFSCGEPELTFDSPKAEEVYNKYMKSYIEEYKYFPARVTTINVQYVGGEHVAGGVKKFLKGAAKYGAETFITAEIAKFNPYAGGISGAYEVGQIIYDSFFALDLPAGDYSVYHVSVFSRGIESNGTFKKYSEFIGVNSFDVYISDYAIIWDPYAPIYSPTDPAYYYYMPEG